MIYGLAKPHLHKPKYKRLPEARRMTIALGIIGQQCIVVAADTQEVYGSGKYPHGKIVSAWRGGPNPLGAICISGAGDAACINVAGQEIVKKFQGFTGTLDEFEVWLRKYVHEFYGKYVMPFVKHGDDRPEFQLLIAMRHERKSCLWITERNLMEEVQPFTVIGITRASSHALLGQLYQPFPSLNVAAYLAAYVVRQAKLSSSDVGFQTEIRFIFREGTSIVPEDTIQKWEEVFSKYQFFQREIFSWLCDFRPLKVMLPGIVSEKERGLKDVLRDLKRFQKELSKFPVMKGLDEPSARTTSTPE